MEDVRTMIHVRLPKDLVKKVDHLAVELESDRARAMEHLLRQALNAEKQIQ
jgi:predicted transcriptional regulator